MIDVFVFPTTRKGESLGLVGLEAMACGTPIIASSIGGILDYVQDGENSWLFPPGDEQALKDKLVMFDELTDAERKQVADKAFETALTYEQTAIQPKLTKIFTTESIS